MKNLTASELRKIFPPATTEDEADNLADYGHGLDRILDYLECAIAEAKATFPTAQNDDQRAILEIVARCLEAVINKFSLEDFAASAARAAAEWTGEPDTTASDRADHHRRLI